MPYITVGAGEISVERGRNAEQLAARGQREPTDDKQTSGG
jgi:hypothetical protein